MKEIGDYLHRVREEKSISLKEIQEATKISMRYLEAIDRGDLEGIPGEVYRKGFLVNFANAIGLDGQEVLQKYYQMKNAAELEKQQQQQQQQSIPQHQYRQEPTPVVVREKTVNSSELQDDDQLKGLYLGIVVALIGILIVASFFLFPYRQNNQDDGAVTKEETSATDTMEAPKSIAPITVNVTFKERVWVQVKSDGEYLYGAEGMSFDSSEPQQVWTAQREMIIRMGNPAGLIISLNGKDLGQLGEKGKTKSIKLTPQGVEAL